MSSEMNQPIFSQNVMESAVEIAYTAGHYQFKTENSRDMMQLFWEWAEELEKTSYDPEGWMELIDTYACEMLLVEVLQGRAIFDTTVEHHLKLTTPSTYQEWSKVGKGAWVYLPELGDRICTRQHFIDLCKGDDMRAYQLYRMCSWQHPNTIIDEAGGLESLFSEELV